MSMSAHRRGLILLLGLPLAWLTGLAPASAADNHAAPTPSAATPADLDWAVFVEAMGSQGIPEGSERERFRWFFTQFKRVLPAGAAFIARHSEDKRRWDAVILMATNFNGWNEALGRQAPEIVAEVDTLMSPGERSRWSRQLAAWVAELQGASDATESQRFTFEAQPLAQRLMTAAHAAPKATEREWDDLRARTEELTARHPALEEAAGFVRMYLDCRFGDDEANADRRKAAWEEYLHRASPLVREEARKALAFLALKGQALGLRFTAADGREVDLAKLRGKVVLIDFWATWCGPCIAELPTIKKVYAEYHNRGFEIIGIALENASLKPADTPAQTAGKLEKAKKVLADFTAQNDLPWPQYFDGKFWMNEISTQYAIQSIPAMFLLDQEGKVVSTSARGEALESEVRRLLKL